MKQLQTFVFVYFSASHMTIIGVEDEMFRLYVGNVDSRATEEAIGQLVGEQGLAVNAIVLKRGYAFIDCPDQQTFDDAINKLNGTTAQQKLLCIHP